MTLHPDNLAQKAEIVVEHFRTKIARQITGKAKAMVVCSSRPHAVRMWRALQAYAADLGYDLGVLVAFSGEVEGLTESRANGFGESQTAAQFDTDQWQIMVVAEKFQTGFDQPKLAAMYVDKTLTGLAAVQTLSRLNRIHPDKSATFVMDFVNDAEEIGDAFAVYHGKTVAPPTDPNLLFDTRRDLDRFDVLDTGEIERAAALLLSEGAHAQVDAALQPAVDRFNGLEDDDQDAFRDTLGRFVRVYRFLSLVVPFRNPGLERDYLYCRALAALIRDREHGQSIDLGSEVELTHLRHEITFEGSIELPGGEGEITTIFSGTGPAADPEHERLSQIIARINERFGTDWTDEDRLVFEAAAGDLVADIEIQNQATNNDEATFRDHVFPERYLKALLSRRDRNSDLIFSYLDSDELQAEVMDIFAVEVQRRATVARQRTCPIGDLLGPDRESQFLEYKSTLRWDIHQQRKGGAVEDAAIKTIAGLANSDFGGTLLIGVADDGSVHGLEDDYATFSKRGQRGDQDLWGQHLQNLIRSRLGDAAMSLVTWEFHTINGNHLARISIAPSNHPIQDHKDGQDTFWLRTPTSTIPISRPQRQRQGDRPPLGHTITAVDSRRGPGTRDAAKAAAVGGGQGMAMIVERLSRPRHREWSTPRPQARSYESPPDELVEPGHREVDPVVLGCEAQTALDQGVPQRRHLLRGPVQHSRHRARSIGAAAEGRHGPEILALRLRRPAHPDAEEALIELVHDARHRLQHIFTSDPIRALRHTPSLLAELLQEVRIAVSGPEHLLESGPLPADSFSRCGLNERL